MNADESVVLYDLVRSGEASRLRRRGAVHVRSTSNSGAIRVDTEGIGGADVSGGYTLLCGVEYEDLEAPLGDEGKYELQALPWTSSSVSAGKQKAVEMRSNLRSTGCGSVIHGHASPRPRLGVWIASRGTSMDEGIVIPTMPEEVTRSACGCVRERVGCAIWSVSLVLRFYSSDSQVANGLVATFLELDSSLVAPLPVAFTLTNRMGAIPSHKLPQLPSLLLRCQDNLFAALPVLPIGLHTHTPNKAVHLHKSQLEPFQFTTDTRTLF